MPLLDIQIPDHKYSDAGSTLNNNRSGGTTVKFGAYFLDETAAATGSTNGDKSLGQLVLPSTALIAKMPQLVIANEAVANAGDPVKCFEGEAVRCKIKVDGSGTAIAKGDKLKPQNASATMVKATLSVVATSVGDVWYAVALGTSTLNGDIIDALLFSSGRR